MTDRWTVQEAKAKLSEILAKARAGKPQRIGLSEGCVVISEEEWNAKSGESLGKWLVRTAPRGEPIELPPRQVSRGDPFAKPAKRLKRRKRK